MTAAINATGLTKDYDGFTAVQDLSFTVERGEVFGIVGPNGAGKTTTLKMLMGLVTPTRGQITIDGLDVQGDALRVKSMIGYLPEESPLYENMQAHQYLHFFADLFNVPHETAETRINSLLRDLDLQPGERRIGDMSKGMRRKIVIARSLINDPQILVYDEPASGLDPMTRHRVMRFIRDMRGDKTVVFSAHDLAQVETLCDRVLLMREGECIALGTMSELRREYGRTEYVIEYRANGQKERVHTGSMGEVNEVAARVVSNGGHITNISTQSSTLEDVFLEIMQE